ncbi:hypothetical protein ABIB57_004003 [Devosia sp. UYZn731]
MQLPKSRQSPFHPAVASPRWSRKSPVYEFGKLCLPEWIPVVAHLFTQYDVRANGTQCLGPAESIFKKEPAKAFFRARKVDFRAL